MAIGRRSARALSSYRIEDEEMKEPFSTFLFVGLVLLAISLPLMSIKGTVLFILNDAELRSKKAKRNAKIKCGSKKP